MSIEHTETRSLDIPAARRPLAEEVTGVFDDSHLAEVSPLFGNEVDKLLTRAESYGWYAYSLHSRVIETPSSNPDTPPSRRARYTLEVIIEDRAHLLRITEPEENQITEDQPTPTFFHLPGFTEMPDGGTAKYLHDDLAEVLPHARIVTVATDGVSRYGQKVDWAEGTAKTFEGMAADRLALAKWIAQEDPVVLLGISMGTPIIKKMLVLNEVTRKIGAPYDVNIMQVINHSHACVPGSRIPVDMVLKFIPHIVRDGWRESRNNRDKLLGFVAVAKAFGKAAPAMAGNIKNLIKGISTEESIEAARAYDTAFISGDRDPLAQLNMLQGLAHEVPSILLHIKRDIGHAACLNSSEAAQDIADAHYQLAHDASTRASS